MATVWRVIVTAGLLAATAACSSGGKKEAQADDQDRITAGDRIDEVQRGVAGAATTPLKDVGLIRPNVHKMLSELDYPYDMSAMAGGCAQVSYEIGALDVLLGEEVYVTPETRKKGLSEKAGDTAGDVAVDAVVDVAKDTMNIIPFRSWVRRASGAAKAERDAARAEEMGHLRRAFLRGYGAAMGCPNVLPIGPNGENSGIDAPVITDFGSPP